VARSLPLQEMGKLLKQKDLLLFGICLQNLEKGKQYELEWLLYRTV